MENLYVMRVIITKILPLAPSTKGGFYRRTFFTDATGESFRLDVYEKHSASNRFNEFLQVGAIFENMQVLDKKKKILDGLSDFVYVGRRQGKKQLPKAQGKLF